MSAAPDQMDLFAHVAAFPQQPLPPRPTLYFLFAYCTQPNARHWGLPPLHPRDGFETREALLEYADLVSDLWQHRRIVTVPGNEASAAPSAPPHHCPQVPPPGRGATRKET